MLKKTIKNTLRKFGYELLPTNRETDDYSRYGDLPHGVLNPGEMKPVWPLPRDQGLHTDAKIKAAFAEHEFWQYAYEFEGGLALRSKNNRPGVEYTNIRRPLQRFQHFMPYLVAACGGSLEGKRVLDIACNSGFWSLQCALLGAEVVGIRRATGAYRAGRTAQGYDRYREHYLQRDGFLGYDTGKRWRSVKKWYARNHVPLAQFIVSPRACGSRFARHRLA